jgi:hypothetical protein
MNAKSLLIPIILLATARVAFAGDVWLEGGKTSASTGSNSSTSVALGFKGDKNWGFKVGMLTDKEFSQDYQDYPVPHSSYRDLGVKRTGNTFGFDVDYYFSSEEGIRPYIGLGMYFGDQNTSLNQRQPAGTTTKAMQRALKPVAKWGFNTKTLRASSGESAITQFAVTT